MQSTLIPTKALAAVMGADDLGYLPRLVDSCRLAGIEALTVCTLPADLRLASLPEAATLVDALVASIGQLDNVRVRLEGRRFYLPNRLRGLEKARPEGFDLSINVDYAGRASLLGPACRRSTHLLLPHGCEPGNLLRWQFARVATTRVDWQSLDPAIIRNLAAHVAEVHANNEAVFLPRLLAAR